MIKKYLTSFLLILISFLSVFLFLYKINVSPPALNADEATNAYDAYSILKTGKDQYGNFMPLRFKSFGDYKLPLLTYLAVPFIKVFGLTETGIRMVNFPFVLLFPLVAYLLTEELFSKKNISIITALFIGLSVGLQSIGRQAHEAYITAFFLTLATYFFLKFIKYKKNVYFSFFLLTFFLDLFGYHSTRLWIGFFSIYLLIYIFLKKISYKYLLIFFTIVSLFIFTDLLYKPTRVANLLFFNSDGFKAKVYELQIEGRLKFLYNNLTVGFRDISHKYLEYFSPQFLAINGDDTYRFGYPGMSPITIVEFLFIFIGLYYLFKNKEKWRYFILALWLFSPISSILAWTGISLTRSLFIIIPSLIIATYGVINFTRNSKLIFLTVFCLYFVLVLYNWDFYLHHYPKRAIVVRAWQSGYKELSEYIKNNYKRFDKFYITKKNGQPYIFLLFYLRYPPNKYQQISSLSASDQYGFGQVEKFDKFIFNLPSGAQPKNSVIIGFPDDFPESERIYLKEIKVKTETIFYIKESATTIL